MSLPKKPVVRSDGKRYESVNDAARDLIKEGGCGRRSVICTGISRVCKGKAHCLTAYGYGWRFE